MSSYFKKGKGWRYDFTLKGIRYTETWFKTKKMARQAEAKKREELNTPQKAEPVQTGMDFFELVTFRLDHVKIYNSKTHYDNSCYKAKKWVALWGKLECSEITTTMIEKFIFKRSRVSAYTANSEIKALRATFNFGKKRKWIDCNPADDVEFLPVEKRIKYVPSRQDIDKVIELADPATDAKDYLITICDTLGRMSEINHLEWKDVDLEQRELILYTRKKKGSHLTPRKVPITKRLHAILIQRFQDRDKNKPWVFWHRYFSKKDSAYMEGPYRDRKRLMRTLCEKAGVKYFRFHAFRHAGATVMDHNNVPLGAIQSILGHENRSTTEIYVHALGNSARNAMDIYESATKVSHTNSHTETKKHLETLL